MPNNKPTKKQHIVPQAYLNRFGMPSGNKYLIGVYDKKNKRYFTESVANVCYIKNYYNVKLPSETKREETYWENFFSTNLEPDFGAPLQRIIAKITLSNHNAPVLTYADKQLLAKLISFQLMRVPQFLDKEMDKFPEIVENAKRSLIIDNPWFSDLQQQIVRKIDFPKDVLKDIFLEMITEEDRLLRIASFFVDKVWTVFYNENSEEFPFVTSDNPVVLYSMETRTQRFDNGGLGRSDTIILYPLSPSIMIAIYPNYMYLGAIGVFDSKKAIIGSSDMEFIFQSNIRQFKNCSRNIFMPIPIMEKLISCGQGLDKT